MRWNAKLEPKFTVLSPNMLTDGRPLQILKVYIVIAAAQCFLLQDNWFLSCKICIRSLLSNLCKSATNNSLQV